MIINVLYITNVPTNNGQANKLLNLDINQNSNTLYTKLLPWYVIASTVRYSK